MIRYIITTKYPFAAVAQRQDILSQDFRDVIDAIIAGDGRVGGLGKRYTRIAAYQQPLWRR
ncbi:hypothetical protein [Erwinia persicina]|uniref:hypothetical protein n=1 Tax=Erwinia persicina TaxID=55211 RepID=UPI00177BB228|nr:hypothetical protein [Erwinia persicina]MBD8165138.1 hypothetical protein [Erwinia persicina]MBD8216557.1 hypothetical protein [Erwinia persicina]